MASWPPGATVGQEQSGRFAVKKLLVIAVLFFGLVIAAGVASQPDRRPAAAGSASGGYSHQLLQRDAQMTQRMSSSSADSPMQRGQVRDQQLDHSQDPAFVRALELHQADIDRMLARPTS